MDTLLYLLKAGTIYAALYLIYFALFRNNTNFQANRIYLLAIIPFAFVAPFINSSIDVSTQYQVALPAFEVINPTPTDTSFNWSILTPYIYLIISSGLLIKLFHNVIKTLRTISTIKKGKNLSVKPFSFFSFIHVPTSIEDEDRAAIMCHENVHSTQIHSLDIIIYEISKVLLWWNPFIWMGLSSVKSNHEFIADKLASEKADKYSSVLVAQLLGVNCSVLANNFKTKPLIKKRIMMMKTKKSNRLSVLKYALVIPVVALTIVATTNQQTIANTISPITQEGEEIVYEVVDKMPEFKGGMNELMKFIGNNVKYPEEAKKNEVEGKSFISFVIDTKGNIKDVSVAKKGNESLDQEAIRVVKSMPKWTPGEHQGKKVNVKFTLPISFKLS